MSLPPWHAEIVDLHACFQAWLDGTTPSAEPPYARMAATIAPEFLLITTGGERVTGAELSAQVAAGHATRPGWRMWSERVELRLAQGGLVVVAYEEWHRQADGALSGRACSAVFREQPAAPNGLAWVLVHETMLPAEAQRLGPRGVMWQGDGPRAA